ncbi:MAG: glycerophosphodiester phosphodiesterase, partial [Parvimonas sp.]|nr:glycerophosphodiester phosphodiesterase [Parvimonas sp.]
MKKILNLAHRGFSGKYPENTKIAFLKAIEHSDCDGFETDVHMTKDKKLVIIHDDTVDRTCSNGSGFIKDLTSKELLQMEFGSHKGREFLGEKIIFLDELLQIVKD